MLILFCFFSSFENEIGDIGSKYLELLLVKLTKLNYLYLNLV